MTKMSPKKIQAVIAGMDPTMMIQKTKAPADVLTHGKESQETTQTTEILDVTASVPAKVAQEELTHQMSQMDQSTYLIHYGVLGMKWGVRKDRRSSGTGRSKASSTKQKISSIIGSAKKARSKQKRVTALKKANKARAKQRETDKKTNNPKKMSDAELTKRIERLELEKKYRSLNQAQLSEGKKVLKNILSKSAENIGGQVATYMMGEAVNKAFQKLMKQENINIVNPRKGQKDK